jgi:hypothetical protein
MRESGQARTHKKSKFNEAHPRGQPRDPIGAVLAYGRRWGPPFLLALVANTLVAKHRRARTRWGACSAPIGGLEIGRRPPCAWKGS